MILVDLQSNQLYCTAKELASRFQLIRVKKTPPLPLALLSPQNGRNRFDPKILSHESAYLRMGQVKERVLDEPASAIGSCSMQLEYCG